MEELIRQAFLQVDVIGPHVQEGHYDLVGPMGEIILPNVWESSIEPGLAITMAMWPLEKSPPRPQQVPTRGGRGHRTPFPVSPTSRRAPPMPVMPPPPPGWKGHTKDYYPAGGGNRTEGIVSSSSCEDIWPPELDDTSPAESHYSAGLSKLPKHSSSLTDADLLDILKGLNSP